MYVSIIEVRGASHLQNSTSIFIVLQHGAFSILYPYQCDYSTIHILQRARMWGTQTAEGDQIGPAQPTRQWMKFSPKVVVLLAWLVRHLGMIQVLGITGMPAKFWETTNKTKTPEPSIPTLRVSFHSDVTHFRIWRGNNSIENDDCWSSMAASFHY